MNTNGMPTQIKERVLDIREILNNGLKAKKIFLDIYKDDGRILISNIETKHVVLKTIFENGSDKFCIAASNSLKTRIVCLPVEDIAEFIIERYLKESLKFSFQIYGLEYVVALLF